MIDASQWSLRGPVRSMRSEIAERDVERSEWKPAWFFNFVRFDAQRRVVQLDQRGPVESIARQTFVYNGDGRLLEVRFGTAGSDVELVRVHHYDGDGRLVAIVNRARDGNDTTRETSTYDAQGRRTTVQMIEAKLQTGNVAFGVDGSEFGYGAPAATTITTRYDEHGRSREAVFQSGSGTVVLRIVMTRDGAGRVVTEEAFQEAPIPLPPSTPESDPEDRARMLALVADVFGVIRTANEFDAHGRLMHRTRQMGTLGEMRTSYTYNEHGDLAEESEVSTDRSIGFEPGGQPQATPDVTRIHDTRLSYEYDARGNWTSRTVSGRFVEGGTFDPSNVERRTIEYYG